MLRLCLLTLVTSCGLVWGQIPSSPCPDIFSYRQDRGNYYGEISIPFDGSKNLNLAVNISMVGLYQNVKLTLELLTPTQEILSTPVLRYRVNFPLQNVIPKITQITFNGRVYCYGPAEPITPNGVTNLWANIFYQINEYTYNIQTGFVGPSSGPLPSNNVNSNVNNYQKPSQNPFLTGVTTNKPTTYLPSNTVTNPTRVSEEGSCGVANDIQTLVLKGEKTVENEFPWLVAMFQRRGVSYEFQCTANLITNKHIITAAHCVRYFNSNLIEKEDILLVLGRSDLSHWASTNALLRTALEVTPHPNYRQDSGHCDVAIIAMNEEVTFKPTVRPICLWTFDSNLKSITGKNGTVAGWGKSEEQRQVVAVPRKVTMPVVSHETCLRSHDDFRNLTSQMTFCAGMKDGSGPCSGDSGGGFIMKRNGKWYLRGLVSTAIRNDDFSCNLNEYIVFADVAVLDDWIRNVLKEK